jgi:hypothetical protein
MTLGQSVTHAMGVTLLTRVPSVTDVTCQKYHCHVLLVIKCVIGSLLVTHFNRARGFCRFVR